METQESFNVKMLTAAVAALSFYFLSDDMDEVRMELMKMFPRSGIHDQIKGVSFGAGNQVRNQLEKLGKHIKNIKTSNKFPKITHVNDTIFYVSMVVLMLTIIIYGKDYWENSSQDSWLRDNGTVLITAMIFTVLVIHSRNTIEFINTFYVNYTSKSVCRILNRQPVIDNFGKGTLGVASFLSLLVVVLLFVVGYYYGDKVRKNDNTDDNQQMKTFTTVAIILSLLFISFFWIIFGCKGMLLNGTLTCLDNYSLTLEDKLVTLAMILLTLSGFLSWSQ